jgi:hypothetical protein
MKFRPIAEARIKSDTIDSQTLAHLMRADLYNRRGIRTVQRDQSDQTGALAADVLREVPDDNEKPDPRAPHQHAIVLPNMSDPHGKNGLTWLHLLPVPEPNCQLLRDNLSLLATLLEHVAATDRLIAELAKDDNIVNRLANLPGIGSSFIGASAV